jgi:hypothetical protein
LTVSKVVAGAGAAATTAVVGSHFGADGTVIGAAVGSVVSAVAATTYEKSLDRTRQVVVSRVRLPTGRMAEVTQVIPAQRPGGAHPTPPPAPAWRPRRLPLLAGATAVVFLVGLLAVTGVELLAGGPLLSSQHGTSVGTVLGYGTSSGSSPSTTVDPTPTTSSTPTTTSTTSTASTASVKPTPVRRANPGAQSPATGSAAAPATTAAPTSDSPQPAPADSSRGTTR